MLLRESCGQSCSAWPQKATLLEEREGGMLPFVSVISKPVWKEQCQSKTLLMLSCLMFHSKAVLNAEASEDAWSCATEMLYWPGWLHTCHGLQQALLSAVSSLPLSRPLTPCLFSQHPTEVCPGLQTLQILISTVVQKGFVLKLKVEGNISLE